jgi:formylglycine-generating enzyme required for sulfatase activity
MISIPTGKFTMGSDDADSSPDEKPISKIYVAAFQMGKYEVTNEQYARFLNSNGGRTEDESGDVWVDATDPTFQLQKQAGRWKPKAGQERHPVVDVTWFGSAAYADWAGARLPTEAEWEKAARGTDGRKYPWGSKWDSRKGNFRGSAAPVGSFPGDVSPYGCMDMGGNIDEWVSSQYRPYPYRSTDGRESLYDSDTARVIRGGIFGVNTTLGRTAFRLSLEPGSRNHLLGFRLART